MSGVAVAHSISVAAVDQALLTVAREGTNLMSDPINIERMMFGVEANIDVGTFTVALYVRKPICGGQ